MNLYIVYINYILVSVLLKHSGLINLYKDIIIKIINNENVILNDEENETLKTIYSSICDLRLFLLNRRNEYNQIDQSKLQSTNPVIEKYKPLTYKQFEDSVLSRMKYLLTISSYMDNYINTTSFERENKTALPFLKFKSINSSFKMRRDSSEFLFSDNYLDNEIDDDDDDQTELYTEQNVTDSNRIENICKSCLFYVEEGNFVPPDEIYEVLSLREVRLLYRIYGFKWLNYLIKNITINSSIDCCLYTFRSSLRGNLYSKKDDDILYQKHHYTSCLDGISSNGYNNLRSSFSELYGTFISLLNSTLLSNSPNYSLIHLLLYNFSLNFTRNDYDLFESIFKTISSSSMKNESNNISNLSWLNHEIWDHKKLVESIAKGEYTVNHFMKFLDQCGVTMKIKDTKDLLIEPINMYYTIMNGLSKKIKGLLTIPDDYSELSFCQSETCHSIERIIHNIETNLLIYFLLYQFNSAVHIDNGIRFSVTKSNNNNNNIPSIQSFSEGNEENKVYLF